MLVSVRFPWIINFWCERWGIGLASNNCVQTCNMREREVLGKFHVEGNMLRWRKASLWYYCFMWLCWKYYISATKYLTADHCVCTNRIRSMKYGFMLFGEKNMLHRTTLVLLFVKTRTHWMCKVDDAVRLYYFTSKKNMHWYGTMDVLTMDGEIVFVFGKC